MEERVGAAEANYSKLSTICKEGKIGSFLFTKKVELFLMARSGDKKGESESAKVTVNKKNEVVSWRHPGGKFLRLGPESCSDSELLAILIGAGVPGKSAEQIANEILTTYQSYRGLANQPFEKLAKIKGLKEIKIVRLAAAFEIARRIVKEVLKQHEQISRSF